MPDKTQDHCKVESHKEKKNKHKIIETSLELNLDAGVCVGRGPYFWKGSKVSAVAKTP